MVPGTAPDTWGIPAAKNRGVIFEFVEAAQSNNAK